MKGSEKQIKWAQEIQDRVAQVLRDGIEMQKQLYPENTENFNGFTSMLNIVAGFDGYAGEMISCFSNFRANGDVRKDLLEVINTARATRVHTQECGELGQRLRALFNPSK